MANKTLVERQQDWRKREVAKVAATHDLADAFARTHLECWPVEQNGQKGYRLEIVGPPEVHQALDIYCERHKIDVETYLEDIGREMLLKAAKDAKEGRI